MAVSASSAAEWSLVEEPACLDFVNTVGGRVSLAARGGAPATTSPIT